MYEIAFITMWAVFVVGVCNKPNKKGRPIDDLVNKSKLIGKC